MFFLINFSFNQTLLQNNLFFPFCLFNSKEKIIFWLGWVITIKFYHQNHQKSTFSLPVINPSTPFPRACLTVLVYVVPHIKYSCRETVPVYCQTNNFIQEKKETNELQDLETSQFRTNLNRDAFCRCNETAKPFDFISRHKAWLLLETFTK